ncbi:ABC transporter ATP-binding protein [Ruminococcaceae bacterium OttesenSCG-928-O06]|nr:ABC transporter ATP-binding protein [Ruminococcaceae bacterium OttesenSCG-928-O06]
MALLQVDHVKKIYTTRFGGAKVQALSDVSFTVEEGEFVAIMGESGSGKTTLLNILASLDTPTAGEVMLRGVPMSSIPEGKLAAFRRQHLGFIFQDFNLLDTFSVEDNIYLPLVLSGHKYGEMRALLEPLAHKLAILDILGKFPYEISGGQKQRVAAARALITSPDIVLADEPTGALDSKASGALLRLLAEVNREGQTILLVTHSARAASRAGRVLFIRDGEVFHQLYRGDATDDELYAKIGHALTVSAAGARQAV